MSDVPLAQDFRFWLGLVGAVTGISSLLLTFLRESRARRTERRALDDLAVKKQASHLILGCERAAAAGVSVKDKSHPEWKDLSTSLTVGEWRDTNYVFVFVEAPYQSRPTMMGDSIKAYTWRKFYICISQPDLDLDTIAVFGHLAGLLRRPGDLSFEVDDAVPKWVRDHAPADLHIGLLFCNALHN